MKQIDKFNKRYNKFLKTKSSSPQAAKAEPDKDETTVKAQSAVAEIPATEAGRVVAETEQTGESEILKYCRKHREAISNFTDDARPIGIVKATTGLTAEKFLIDPFSNVLYNGAENALGEVLYFDGDLFTADASSYTDFAAGYLVRNLRGAVMKRNPDGASGVVERVTENYTASGNRFYLLSDDVDVFGKNVKAAFRGCRAVWRSVAAAYMLENYDGDISVVDFMCGTVTQVTLRAEFSKKHNKYIFTRVGRRQLHELDGLGYPNVSKEFVKFLLDKYGLKYNDTTVENLSFGNQIYNVICSGNTEHFVVGKKILTAGKKDFEEFFKTYFINYGDKLSQISDCIVWADHLKNGGLYAKCKFADNRKLNAVLDELDYRVKNGIPLWRETLPALRLDRVALKGRLGNYYLVKENEVVENTFETATISCPEKLKLPANEKEILFPLSISGISDKHYVAKVSLEEPFAEETECRVTLLYDFNDEKTYSFSLRDACGKSFEMTIEEGEPQKAELPFEMEINSDINDTFGKIAQKIKELKEQVAKRKTQYSHARAKEKPWEYAARSLSNEIFSLWITLPYAIKKDKGNFSFVDRDVENIIYYCVNPDYLDDTDYMTVMYVRVVMALFTEGYDIAVDEYNGCVQRNINSVRIKTTSIVASRILCNPSISDRAMVDAILKNTDVEIRTLSQSLIANDAFLYFMAEHKMQVLSKNVKKLFGYIQYCRTEIERHKDNLERIPNILKKIRDGWEFCLGILKLRGTDFWNNNLARINDLLAPVVELEQVVFEIIRSADAEAYTQMCVNKLDKYHQISNFDIIISRIKFAGIEQSLSLMHPLGYTLITYLEGNPHTHIIGCGLFGE